MKKLILVILLNCSCLFFVKAQIVPPDFLCIKGDTLFWELPVNTCGAFVSYDIYTSDNINGPYSLLALITDQMQGFFHHPNPAGLLQYYYLLSNFDCPGQTPFSSDTLDSRPPEVSPLLNITVQGNDVLLDWETSPSPEVYAYIVYRRDAVGVIPIDTVFNGVTDYTDPNAEPNMESESYFVNALDRCGNTSIFEDEHKTMFLQAIATNCSIDLSWNLYEGWDNIDSQEIWVSENGGTPVLHVTLDATTPFYSFRDVNDGASYCFFIKASEMDTNELSISNEVCLTASFSQPINELFITNINVLADNTVSLDWRVNANADVEIFEYLRSEMQNPFGIIETIMPATNFPVINQYYDETVNADIGPISYQLHVIDSCDNELTSAVATTIFLNGSSLSTNTNLLTWTPLEIENANVTEYQIIRILNGLETGIGSVNGSQLEYQDVFDPLSIGSGTICYYAVATGSALLPDGSQVDIRSRSNVFCLDQATKIFVPNAFAPSGFNREFKPVILSGNIAKYEMQIYDRYGSIVFSTDDPDIAWKGKKEGNKLPQGVYVYHIRLELGNGNKAEKKGYVTLLR